MTISDLEFSIRSAEAALGPASQFALLFPSPPFSRAHRHQQPVAELCVRVLLLRKLSPQQGCSGLFIGNCVYLHMFIYHSSFSQQKKF